MRCWCQLTFPSSSSGCWYFALPFHRDSPLGELLLFTSQNPNGCSCKWRWNWAKSSTESHPGLRT